MNAKKESSIKVNAKAVNAACKGITAKNNTAKKELKNGRKTLRATVAYLATEDGANAESFRAFLKLKKNANKTERTAVCNWITARYLYVTTKYVVTSIEDGDSVNVESFGIIPCNKNGKTYNDTLDAITEIKKVYEKTIQARNEIARQMWDTRAKLIAKGIYKEHIANVLSYVNGAPKKFHNQVICPDIIERK